MRVLDQARSHVDDIRGGARNVDVTPGVVYDDGAEANRTQIGRRIRNARRERGETKRCYHGETNSETAAPTHALSKGSGVPGVIPRTG